MLIQTLVKDIWVVVTEKDEFEYQGHSKKFS